MGQERISIDCHNIKAKVITLANQKKGNYNKEPIRTQGKTYQPFEAREIVGKWVTVGFSQSEESKLPQGANKNQGKNLPTAWSAGKRGWTSHGWF